MCMMKPHRKGHCPKRRRNKLKSILSVQVVQSRRSHAARLLLKLDVHVVQACGQAGCCFASLQRGTGSRYEGRQLSMINDDLPPSDKNIAFSAFLSPLALVQTAEYSVLQLSSRIRAQRAVVELSPMTREV
ncbi:hypothetical protein CGRA01v4_11575 [Colletotrichum graminicola]|nr:hypothetical protein CGRA01v4_11575 [Colletotrichum graminicola]